MSNLYSQLGPQGRALLQRSGATYSTTPGSASPQELDFLINELRHPKPDLTVNKVLGYLYNYVPYVKQEHNLRVLVSAFLSSPTCFDPPATYQENFAIVDVVRLIFEKKLKVSQPTLSIKTFYRVWEEEIKGFVNYNVYANSWKVLPIIAGIDMANKVRDQLYTEPNKLEYGWFFNKFDRGVGKLFRKCLNYSLTPALPTDITYLAILSLAVVYQRGEPITEYTKHVSSDFVVELVVLFLFGDRPDSLLAYRHFFDLIGQRDTQQVEQAVQQHIYAVPAVRFMNKLAFVLEAYFSKLPHTTQSFQLIMWSLSEIEAFNQNLSIATENTPRFNSLDVATRSADYIPAQFWQTLKQIMFTEVIIFTGILTRYITSGRRITNPFTANPYINPRNEQVALRIVTNLYYLNFILEAIGSGGFDAYNFVYYLSNELALKTNQQYVDVTKFMVGPMGVNMDPAAVNDNYVMQSRLLFTLGLWENYMSQPKFDEQFAHKFIFPFCYDVVANPHYHSRQLIEAAHSVLLIFFGKSRHQKVDDCIDYVGLIYSQHPRLLSATQFSVAIETVGKSLLEHPVQPRDRALPDSGEEFLRFLLHLIQQTRSDPLHTRDATFSDQTLRSAQPVGEILATSTLKRMDEDEVDEHNIVEQNDASKPFEKLFDDASKHVYAEVNDKLGQYIPRRKRAKPEHQPHPAPSATEYQFTERVHPNTVREAAVNTIINLVPYIPLSRFVAWLDEIYLVILASEPEEQRYLCKSLWVVISENLDLNRCGLAYPWWYETVKMPSTMPFIAGGASKL
ncbi:hypothetical protein DIURU_001009 [Diutina rugosa]|uniref:Uncharacterized protein n=1 Tax=Diutina rugosa TaxID=5481 RepID=A0A642UXU2_DIURU|nr:uncharacterized protein DIURU_001009 [Diutina rugosa]KAA8906600.1 hypothetical protein DIURU_001009 [Diutina rugosa]